MPPLRLYLAAILLLLPFLGPLAAEPEAPIAGSHAPFEGEPFFLLTDATFGSADRAQVRLEVNAPQALAQTGGVDIVVYRIGEPIEFLRRQRNLHRIQVDAAPAGEGLANTLTHLWDNWVVKARQAWQRLFSAEARRAVTAEAPQLKTPKALGAPSRFEEPRPFRPLPGLPVVDRFRYPLPWAKPIAPPKDLKLAGSSSEFIRPSEGNVFVPLGRRAPGLYLVEAIAGVHRATTLLFVADTVAITKVSGEQMLVWAAQRTSGAAVPGTKVLWTDGVGVLARGETDRRGLVALDRRGPEQTFLFGEDPQGGVFISENFYYDSEIYTAKVYAVTDRPLYRPGDTVQVKVVAREFRSARTSAALADGTMKLVAYDPAGQPVATQSLAFSGVHGGDAGFVLPDNAPAGGYELRLALHDGVYSAAFRVADYTKPHFEMLVLPDKADFATGEAVSGKLQLAYPDGRPVARARVSLSARAQQLTMVDGELDDSGAFPLKLKQLELETDGDGRAAFTLPAADQPARYILSALATDGAAYRVRTTREILVERGSTTLRLVADRQFSRPGEKVGFRIGPGRAEAASAPARAVRWEWLRLENRARESGPVSGDTLALAFAQPGSYTVSLRDERGRLLAAASHWVSGDGQKAPAGSIGIVFDRTRYRAGDTAEALVTFPQPTADALLTLERDRVEQAMPFGAPAGGIAIERLNPTQWRVRVPVTEAMSPNVTLSVAAVKDGDYVFQNQGLLVEQPRIEVALRTAKPVYAPGETVELEVSTTLAGAPVPAEVAVGVVDEMIYVLQPEIAPTIDEFFFHPRRNNVRTSASLAFIGYDLATRKLGELPSPRQVNERAIKVQERPRRDDVDTAAWQPRLVTDATGRARMRFTMPDALTRWRITGRAIAPEGPAAGLVGQQVAWVRSDQPFYAKWTSPDWRREGDRPVASVALFNQAAEPRSVEWQASGPGIDRRETLTLKPGATFVALPIPPEAPAGELTLTLRAEGRPVDRLRTPLKVLPVGWRSPREQRVDLSAGSAALSLPADATRVQVSLAGDPAAAAFSRWIEALADFPYGCVEQTASRLLPLSLALQSLGASQQPLAPMLTQRIAGARLALAQMAGPEARFGWWGRGMAADPFLTAYAYYADWRAAQALGLALPAAHWERLLAVVADGGAALPVLQRALVLAWMHEMKLPVGSLLAALAEALLAAPAAEDAAARGAPGRSAVLGDARLAASRDAALVLVVLTRGAAAGTAERAEAEAAAGRLAALQVPLFDALRLAAQPGGADTPARALALLDGVGPEAPTFDRAQALVWIQRALGARAEPAAGRPALAAPWEAVTGASGLPVFRWPEGGALPARLALAGEPRPATAIVRYESRAAETATLPAKIERTLWKLVPARRPAEAAAAEGASLSAREAEAAIASARLEMKAERVEPGTPLDTRALYLDELQVATAVPLRWALLEVGLPPGASVEPGTWGIALDPGGGQPAVPLERATHQPIAQGYAVPIEALAEGGTVTVRHLLRFAQRGRFALPPARLHRMYDPEAKAFDAGGRWAAMEVRE